MEPAAKVFFTRAEAIELTHLSDRFINKCLQHLGRDPRVDLLDGDALAFIQKVKEELNRPLQDRAAQMVEMYKDMTLEEIGLKMGVTRERVRQILKRMGVTGRQRQVDARKINNQRVIEARMANLEKRCRDLYLCSFDEFKKVTGEQKLRCSVPLVSSYRYYRTQAIRRRIPWQVTLPEFKTVIGDHLGKMRINRLCLVRTDEGKPFVMGNVTLKTIEEISRSTITRRFQRQTRALELYRQGWSHVKIADELKISPARVAHYVSSLEGNEDERPVRKDEGTSQTPSLAPEESAQHQADSATA